MLSLGPLSFGAPWLLAALAALPALWWLMRALPPAPRQLRFPGTALLLGLEDRNPLPRRTPWWIVVLRMLALACVILAAAGPVWRPAPPLAAGRGPLLIVVDAGWAAAPGWQVAMTRLRGVLEDAGARPVALLLADGRSTGTVPFSTADEVANSLKTATPAAWETAYPEAAALDALLATAPADGLETLWLSDGLDHPGRKALADAVSDRGRLRVLPPVAAPVSLMFAPGEKPALVTESPDPAPRMILARGPDPQGIDRVLARLAPGDATITDGIARRPVALDLPTELRNRVNRFEVENVASAGAVWLADERTKRRKIALVGPGSGAASEGQALLSPLHYLHQALSPFDDLVEGGVSDVLQSAPDVIMLADEAVDAEDSRLSDWVEGGGTLIRFAGPHMTGDPALDSDPLLPVRLRPGGRDIGGALSWGAPRGIDALPEDGPFAGLATPSEIGVRVQLMAEPGPELSSHTLASLEDGTPLVTRARRGDGQVVLFHVTADPAWSDLPLTGLFVEMLKRLVETARLPTEDGSRAGSRAEEGDDGGMWRAESVLQGDGQPADAADALTPVSGAALDTGPAPAHPPGIWLSGDRRRAVNAGLPLHPADWPSEVMEDEVATPGLALSGWLLALAALALALDAAATALLTRGGKGGSRGRRREREAA